MKDMSMKAVKRLGKSCKNLFKMDNARVLLLEMAKDYLNHSQLEEATDKQYQYVFILFNNLHIVI